MNLYEIDQAIMSLIDEETGEIKDYEAFAELQMDKEAKIENTALYIKNLLSDAEQLKAEKLRFAERQKQAEAKAESLKTYLDLFLAGEKFSSTKVSVTYRWSSSVDVYDISKIPEKYLKFADPTANKTAISTALKNGEVIEGAKIVEKNNIQIK